MYRTVTRNNKNKKMLNKLIFGLVAYISIIGVCDAQGKKNWNTKPYPYGNPVITHMYTADAAPHVMPDGRVWMVTSVDHEDGGGYSSMHSYHTFSSEDMVNWTDHGEVLNIWDVLGADVEPEGEDWALWAPDMIYRNGKYYLYFPVRILYKKHGYDEKKRKTASYIAVAVADAPDQRFKVINRKIEGTRGIDPAVFIDDNDQPYLYYGNHYGAKLKENMYELDGKPVHMKVDDEHFMEAIWMNKKDDKYYLSYHSHYGKPIDPKNPDDEERLKSLLSYGVSDKPLGPFNYMGTMNYELGKNVNRGPKLSGYNYVPWRLYQSNHGGIVEFHGKEYLFYHTSALSSWRQDEFRGSGTWTQRSVCVDELKYDRDGAIIPVQQTIGSVNKVVVDQPFSIELMKGEANNAKFKKGILLTNSQKSCIKFTDVNLGTGYYYFGVKVLKSGNAKLEVRVNSEKGLLLGTIKLSKKSSKLNGGISETFLRNAKGTKKICLVLINDSGEEIKLSHLKFFAGDSQ